jgi:octaprenyl-diphosphate synthase
MMFDRTAMTLVEPQLESLETFISNQLNAFQPEIQEAVRYVILKKGKRLRPIMLFLSAFDAPATLASDLVKAAAIVEITHIATLIHDDVLDNADVRHKAQTVSKKYGVDTAVLLGDALFAHALYLSTQFETVAICRHVSAAVRELCSGEIIQSLTVNENKWDWDMYLKIVQLKTGELFGLAAFLGSFIAQSDAAQTHTLLTFGNQLGALYQILDDILDVWGNEKEVGKTLHTDFQAKKLTLPVILLKQILSAPEYSKIIEGNFEDFQYALKKHAILQKARTIFEKELQKANDILTTLPSSAQRIILSSLTESFQTAIDSIQESQL